MQTSQILKTLREIPTPLNTTFFSNFNISLIQRSIRQRIKNVTGRSIDYQSPDDVVAIMRVVYITNKSQQYQNVRQQVEFMNNRVVDMAQSQIQTNLAQFLHYVKDLDEPLVPLNLPVSTTNYGKKIDYNTKIGV